MIFILLICYLASILFTYSVFSRDIFSPSVFMGAGYVLAICCAIYNIKAWSISISGNTVIVMVSAYLVFVFFEFIIRGIWIKKNKCILSTTNAINSEKVFNKINIPNYMCILFDAFVSVVAILYFKNAYEIACNHGYAGIGNFLTYYRKASSYGILSAEEMMNPLVEQLFKFVTVGAYIFSYVLINDFLSYGHVNSYVWRKTIKYRIPIYVFFVATISTAGRLQYIKFVVALLLMVYILYNKKYSWKKNTSSIIIKYGIVVLVFLLVAFFLLANTVGRTVTQTPIDYLTRYAGSPIYLFDKFLKNPLSPTSYFGGETFYGIYTGLRKLGLSHYYEIHHLEFRSLGNLSIGSNTYTAIRRYYRDFGFAGVVVMQMIMSLIINAYYYFVVRNALCTDIKIMIYCFFYYSVPLHPINELFFSLGFSLGSLVYVLYFVILWNALILSTKVRFRWNR